MNVKHPTPTAVAIALAALLTGPLAAQSLRTRTTGDVASFEAPATATTGTAATPSAGSAPTTAPTSAATLTIDVRDTGVDLGLGRNADGTLESRAGSNVPLRTPGMAPSIGAAAGGGGASTPSDRRAAIRSGDALGDPNDALSHAAPGTSALGTPTTAGRPNGNSTVSLGNAPAASGAKGTRASNPDAITAAQAAAHGRSINRMARGTIGTGLGSTAGTPSGGSVDAADARDTGGGR